MKYCFTVLFLLIVLNAFCQQITYDEWKEKAKSDIRFLPEYGHLTKNDEQLKADNEFIGYSIKQSGNRKKASEELVQLGFTYLYKGDLQTAIYRFNQAWLLDNNNENAFWGFGAIYGYFSDYDNALIQYDKGLSFNPKSSNILTDKATIYMMKFQKGADNRNLNSAISYFAQSYKISPDNQNTLYKLSISYFFKNDCLNAVKYYDLCMKLGGKPIAADFTKALNEKCRK